MVCCIRHIVPLFYIQCLFGKGFTVVLMRLLLLTYSRAIRFNNYSSRSSLVSLLTNSILDGLKKVFSANFSAAQMSVAICFFNTEHCTQTIT